MAVTEKKVLAVKLLLIVVIMVCPVIGCLLLSAAIIDFLRVRKFKRPIFCILPEVASQDSESRTYAGFCYSFEIKENSAYTARILNTPVMAGARD